MSDADAVAARAGPGAVRPAGQVTVSVSRSTSKRVLGEPATRADRRLGRHRNSIPAGRSARTFAARSGRRGPHGVVPAAAHLVQSGAGSSARLGGGEARTVALVTFGRDRQHSLDSRRMFRMVESREGEQRLDRSQPPVSGADAVVPSLSGARGTPRSRRVEVGPPAGTASSRCALRRSRPGAGRVPVAGDGVGAGAALRDDGR